MQWSNILRRETPEARARRLRDEAWNAKRRGGVISTAIIGACDGIQLVEDEALELVHKGNQAYEGGDYSAAISLYEQAIHLQGDYVDAHNNLGNAYDRRAMYTAAIGEYVSAIRYAPEYIADKIQFIYINIAKTLMRKGLAQSTVKEYEKLTTAIHRSSGHHCALGLIWHELGDVKRSQGEYEQSIAADPDGVCVEFCRGALADIRTKK
jgi:tetratricopeptide (TPR) repeat protein